MKKIFLVLTLFVSIVGFTQETEETNNENLRQNELRINGTNFIIFSFLDISYERILNEDAAVGIGVLTRLDSNRRDDFDYYRSFSITPYYRNFFSRKYAQGFFVEGFGMLHTSEEDYVNDIIVDEKITSFALGISAGAKFMTKNGFIAEIYLGVGRNIINSDDFNNAVGRGGISLGYRF